jgi:ABC-type branched-subunit amino acid transport system ATPase component
MLAVEDLHVGYGKKDVLRGVSIAVQPREIVALIGPNGAGKSTLLKAVAGLLNPSAGRIFFEGRDVTDLPAHQRMRAGLAYALQGGAIFSSLTVQDHLALGGLMQGGGRRRSEQWASDTLLPAALAARGGPAGLLSGGQRQSLALATVLSREPAMLLCDEPSAGLAPAAASNLLRKVAALSRQRQLPVLWVEQRIGDILQLADRAILLRDGKKAAETGNPKDWLSADLLAEMTFGRSHD